jgi:L-ascorbate metabolism protein UlaG (beta-lactamase superfamily)
MQSLRRAAPSDHFDGQRFFNPSRIGLRSFGDFLRWQFSREKAAWPEWVTDEAQPLPPAPTKPGDVAATFIGHATFLLRSAGFAVLTDPIFSLRASPFGSLGPKRIRAPAFAIDALPKIDAVCLSHNHYDHMDLPSLRALQVHSGPVIVTGIGNGAYLASRGIANVVELDWWESVEPVPGLNITYVPAQHWSRRRFWDTNHMLWGGHVVEARGSRVYFPGDTGYPSSFAEIGRRCGAPDIALLPIGAYEPRWFMAPQHMNPEEAVRAHRDLGGRLSVGVDFRNFHLADEAFGAPEAALAAARAAHGVAEADFRVPEFGETIIRK